jgi:hypothetical protein
MDKVALTLVLCLMAQESGEIQREKLDLAAAYV